MSVRLTPFPAVLAAALALAGCSLAPAPELGAAPASLAEGPAAKAGLRPRTLVNAIQVGGLTTDVLRQAALAADPRGTGYQAVWHETRGDQSRVYTRRLDAQLRVAPLADGRDLVRLDAGSEAQAEPAIAGLGEGFVAAWRDGRGDAPGVYLRRISRAGVLADLPARLGGPTAAAPALATTGAGALAAWLEDGRLLAAPIGDAGVGAASPLAERGGFLGGFLGLGAGPAPERPVVAAGPDRALVAWRAGGQVLARLTDAAGTPVGEAIALGAGLMPALAYDPDGHRFLAAWQGAGGVVARTVGEAGQPGPVVAVGPGGEPAVAYDANAKAFEAVWRTDGYLARQRLDGALAPIGPTALIPGADAHAPRLVWDVKAGRGVVACEERIYAFDRLTVLPLR